MHVYHNMVYKFGWFERNNYTFSMQQRVYPVFNHMPGNHAMQSPQGIHTFPFGCGYPL